jgi:hypothetical protein
VALGDADGRNTQFIASAKPVGRIDPPAIYPHFSTTQNTVEMALRNPLATADQEIIETLALLFFVITTWVTELLPALFIF